MATTNLVTKSHGDLVFQHGNGIPDHTSPLGSEYVDLDTGLHYVNTGGVSWSGGGGGGGLSLRNVSSTDTFTMANETINCTSGTFTISLPTAVGIQGTTYTLLNSGTGVITLEGNGAETINGSLSITLTQYESRTVQSNGSNWIII